MSLNDGSKLGKVTYGLLVLASVFLLIVLLTSLGIFMIDNVSIDALNNFKQGIKSFGFYMQFVRWTAYLAAWFYWLRLIGYVGNLRGWEQQTIDRALSSRNSTAAWVLFVEVFIIQDIGIAILGYLVEKLN